MTRPPKVHDYTLAGRGHDALWVPREGTDGHEGAAVGVGEDVAEGDFLLFPGPNGGASPYRVVRIRYLPNRTDRWQALLVYDPAWK